MKAIRKKHGHFLKLLLTASGSQQFALLKAIEPSQMKAVVEIVYNVMVGNRHLTRQTIKKLNKHKRVIRRFVRKGLTVSQRKRLLQKYFPLIKPLIEAVKTEL